MHISLLTSVLRVVSIAAMNLTEYLNEVGNKRLAEAIGVSTVVISQWKTGARRVPAEYCPLVERATNGAVRCEEMRPDVDWAYLRGTGFPKKVSPAGTAQIHEKEAA